MELLIVLALPTETFHTQREIRDGLLLRRTEMENGVDVIVREGLQEGLIGQLPPETIKNAINSKIIHYLNAFPANHHEPITYENGFGHLTQQSYLSLLLQPLEKELSLASLNHHSHVLVLPVSQTARYGEYTYTGGLTGTRILIQKMSADNHATFFALPTGYRVCSMTGVTEFPCEIGGK